MATRDEHIGDDAVETPRRYWIGVVIIVLAILLIIGMSLVLFVASDSTGSTTESLSHRPAVPAA